MISPKISKALFYSYISIIQLVFCHNFNKNHCEPANFPCSVDNDCCESLTCDLLSNKCEIQEENFSLQVSNRFYCKHLGDPCHLDKTCCGDHALCQKGKCCTGLGENCNKHSDCCHDNQCERHRCCAGERQVCTRNSDCCLLDYVCRRNLCQPVPRSLGEKCRVQEDCINSCHEGRCCVYENSICSTDYHCCLDDLFCINGRCRFTSPKNPCKVPGYTCRQGEDCCGVKCTNGICCNPHGDVCKHDNECCVQEKAKCQNSKCCVALDGRCAKNEDCCFDESETFCSDNKTCKRKCRSSGLSCKQDDECCGLKCIECKCCAAICQPCHQDHECCHDNTVCQNNKCIIKDDASTSTTTLQPPCGCDNSTTTPLPPTTTTSTTTPLPPTISEPKWSISIERDETRCTRAERRKKYKCCSVYGR